MEYNEASLGLYIRQHPLLKEANVEKRKQYIDFMYYYLSPIEERFTKSMFSLFNKVIVGDENYTPVAKSSISGLFKYRLNLCLDVWFISAFHDKDKADYELKRIVEESHIPFFNKKKLIQLYERLYIKDNGIRFPKIERLLDLWSRNQKFFNENVQKVVFTANMSAGKSTLVNALVGKKVNKSQSMACTAKLHHIYNKPFEDGFSAEDDNVLNLDADYMTLMTDDEENTSSDIIVSTFFRLSFGKDSPICFLDTPGVNSSLDNAHKEVTDAEIIRGSFDKIVYVINADGNIASDDEHQYMTQLRETIRDTPIIFVVNKLDSFRIGQDSIPDSLRKIREDIKNIGFENALVCPVSAYTGYLAKRHFFENDLDEDEQDEYEMKRRQFKKDEYNLSVYYSDDIISKCNALIESESDPHQKNLLQLLLNCGLLPLEYVLTIRKRG